MTRPVSDIAFTPAVKSEQERQGSRKSYAKMEKSGGWTDRISPEMQAFIAERNSFYLGTASAAGQPYIQHRGGPKGFLRVLDERTLALAEFSGNQQFISMGNLTENDRAYIFLMDYANRRRVKIWGRAEFVEDDPQLLAQVTDAEYAGRAQRVLRFHVEALDINCPQHIPRLYPEDERLELTAQIERLQMENRRLQARLDLSISDER